MKKRTSYTVDTVFVLVLFAVFAITVLFVLMSGAGVYKDTQAVMQERYEERTCVSYITSKINHYDEAGKVYVTDFGGFSALALEEEISGREFTTYIYCYEGQVKELVVEKGLEFEPSAGNNIIEAQYLNFSSEDNLINIKCIGEEGTVSTVSVNVIGETEVAA